MPEASSSSGKITPRLPAENSVAAIELIKFMLDEREVRYDQRWSSHSDVHVLLKEAIDTAVASVNERLAGMNEMRSQINTERGMYITRDVYDAKHEELKTKLGVVEQWKSNMDGRLWMLGTILGALTIITNLLLHYWPKT